MDPLDQQLAAVARALETVRITGLERVSDVELLKLIATSGQNEPMARALRGAGR